MSLQSIIALVFFITYTLVQPVATILCRKIGVRRFLAGITLAWGILMICFGLPNSWGPLVAMRLILGLLEGGFFPGCVYLISTWYTRYELQKRYSVFYMIGCVAGACAGILAYGLMQMDGVANYAGQYAPSRYYTRALLTCRKDGAGFSSWKASSPHS